MWLWKNDDDLLEDRSGLKTLMWEINHHFTDPWFPEKKKKQYDEETTKPQTPLHFKLNNCFLFLIFYFFYPPTRTLLLAPLSYRALILLQSQSRANWAQLPPEKADCGTTEKQQPPPQVEGHICKDLFKKHQWQIYTF